MHTTFLPIIYYFIAYNPATERAPAGYRMMAYSSYI